MQLLFRKSALMIMDVFFIVTSLYIAYLIHFDWVLTDAALKIFLNTFWILVIIKISWFMVFNLYTSLWRYASTKELWNIILANICATITGVVINAVFKLDTEASIMIVSFLLCVAMTGGFRLSYRLAREERAHASKNKKDRIKVMIVGAGEAGAIVIKELQNVKHDEYVPVLVIDDDPTKDKKMIMGVKIALGSSRIPEYAKKYNIDEIIIAIPSAPLDTISRIIDFCRDTNCTIKIIPGIKDLFNGKINYSLVRSQLNKSSDKIWLASPHMSDEGFEIQYVQEAFDTNWITSLGRNVSEFEKEVAESVNIKYAAALVSGTSAIHMAMKAAGVEENDIVLCQDLTFSATANPIIYQHAKPVFIDSDFETWNMDPNLLEKAFIKYPNAKAVIIVHLYGLSCDMDRIMEVCKRHNAVLIEDAAESLGSFYKGQHTGTFGEYGIFSFNGNKIITTSGGGMLVTNNLEKINKVYSWATQSREPARYYQHTELGFNYRMSNVVAGIGRGQLKVLNQRVAKKSYIFETYKRELNKLEGLRFMPVNSWNSPNYWLTCITLTGRITPIMLIEALEKENIEARHLWKPMHMQPFFENYDFIGNGVSEALFSTGVCLPSDTKMSDDDLKRVIKIIKSVWDRK
jgi:dTDP-4-amino-4,6-dideoxygalactose transaminase